MKLKKSKVAMFSDLHLGIYGNSEQWHEIAKEWATWMVKDLKKNKIKDILFLGDFFHNRSEISVQTMHVASEILDMFSSFNMVMIVGNHDAFYKNRADVHSLGLLRGHKNITVVDELLSVSEFDKDLLFVPWNTELPEGKYDYIFGHFEIRNFKMNNYKLCDHGLDAMDFLADRTKEVFSGHFHHRNTKKYNEGNIHYIGNTFPMDYSDVANIKGYYTLDFEDGEMEFIENPVSPKFKKIILSNLKSYTADDYKHNIVKLVVDVKATEEQVAKIQTYIAKFGPSQFFTEYNTTNKTVEDVEEIDSIDLLESIEEFIEQMKMEDEQMKRVETIMINLYEKNKV